VLGIYTLMIDVDHDHRMREELERKEAQLRYFAENIPGPAAVVDAELRYVFVNNVFERIRGQKLVDIVGTAVRDNWDPGLYASFLEPLLARLRRGEHVSYERLIGPKGGEQRWHLINVAPLMDAAGNFNGYFSVGSDIHDIKAAQERLHEQEAQLRLYTDNIPDSVAYLDRTRRILFANRHFAEQRGLRVEDVIGRTTRELMGEDVARWIAERTQRCSTAARSRPTSACIACPRATSAGTT
jgi:PAS domain S-box-containing protein